MTWNWEKMKKTIDDAAQKAQGVAKDIKEDYEKYLENEKNKQNQDDVIEAEIVESMESLNNSNNNDNNNSETINSANITEKPIQVKISDNLNNSDITVEIKQETNVEHKQDELNNLSDLNKSNDSDDYNESLDLSESKETETLDALASNHTNELNIKELFDNQVAENKELDELLEKLSTLKLTNKNKQKLVEELVRNIEYIHKNDEEIALKELEQKKRNAIEKEKQEKSIIGRLRKKMKKLAKSEMIDIILKFAGLKQEIKLSKALWKLTNNNLLTIISFIAKIFFKNRKMKIISLGVSGASFAYWIYNVLKEDDNNE
jgi:uncharacterized protein PFB0145c